MKRDMMSSPNKFSFLEWNSRAPIHLPGSTILEHVKCRIQSLTSKSRSNLFIKEIKLKFVSKCPLSLDHEAQHPSNNHQICHKSSPTPLTKENLQSLPTSSNQSCYISEDQMFERVSLGLPTKRMAGLKVVQAWQEKWEAIG